MLVFDYEYYQVIKLLSLFLITLLSTHVILVISSLARHLTYDKYKYL